MRRELLAIMQCPNCRSVLELYSELEESGRILTGRFSCTNCHSIYPIRDGIPVMTEGLSKIVKETQRGFQFQWKARKDGKFEADRLYGKSEADELNQFFDFLNLNIDQMQGKLVMDAGCGSGRLVRLLADRLAGQAVEIVGIDLTASKERIADDALLLRNVTIVQCDILHLPFKENIFDIIWSGGVINLTGNIERAFRNLSSSLKPGGRLYLWVYSIHRGPFGAMRRILTGIHKLPAPILFRICQALALPVFFLSILLRKGGQLASFHKKLDSRYKRKHTFREIVFKLFDQLSCPHISYHTESDLRSLFVHNNFGDITSVVPSETGGVGMRGQKNSGNFLKLSSQMQIQTGAQKQMSAEHDYYSLSHEINDNSRTSYSCYKINQKGRTNE